VCVVRAPVPRAGPRYQNMVVVNGVAEFSGVADTLVKTVRSSGVLSLWRGFTPYFLRLGPHTIVSLMTLEQLKALYFRLNA
jgi:solute carrier family 25 oxoglutarate transporter 11